jgi:uncharacterized membrane protein
MSEEIKINWRTEWFAVGLLVLSLVLGVYFYQHFPAQVPLHWNWRGQVDSYSSAAWGAFLLPGVMLALYILFLVLPKIDPRRERYMSFTTAYTDLRDLLLLLFFAIFWLTGLAGLGYSINIGWAIPVMIGLFFMALGSLLQKVKMNWFMGIRTPWTLSSEEVWGKTHKLAGPIFAVSGLLLIVSAWTTLFIVKISLFILAIVLIVLGLPLYSYLIFRTKQIKKK